MNRSPVVGTTKRCSSLAQSVTLMGDYNFSLFLLLTSVILRVAFHVIFDICVIIAMVLDFD